MADQDQTGIPVWMLATQDVAVPPITDGGAMTPERLGELRTVLAAFADSPVATLEAYPLPKKLYRNQGGLLHG